MSFGGLLAIYKAHVLYKFEANSSIRSKDMTLGRDPFKGTCSLAASIGVFTANEQVLLKGSLPRVISFDLMEGFASNLYSICTFSQASDTPNDIC